MARKCNLIVDSCCDLPYPMLEREGVQIIQFPYVMSDGDHFDDMYQSISPQDFFQAMRDGEEPSTSQISLPKLVDTFKEAVADGMPAVFLCFSANMSGSYDVACMAADQVMADVPGSEVLVADTGLACFAEGLLVYEALRQWNLGLTARELKEWAEEARYYVNCRFMVDDLDSLVRGGRLPALGGYLGSKLDVKPLITFSTEGKLTMTGVVRGRKKAMKQMAEFFAKNLPANEENPVVVIGHADCHPDLDKLRGLLSKQCPGATFIECNVGPVIGSHVGPGMMALVFWGEDRRNDVSIADRIARRVKGN